MADILGPESIVHLRQKPLVFFLTKPAALDESAYASTIASSLGSAISAIATESDFAVSSLDVAIL